MTNNDRLVEWLKKTVKHQFAGQVALVCLYGSYINGTEEPGSDVDCYFVPKTEKGLTLARTFIIDNVGYDIFPMSWERLEATADLQNSQQPLVGDVQVLYADTAEDLARLQAIQSRLQTNLQDVRFRNQAAEQRFQRAWRRMPQPNYTLKESRLSAGGLLMDLAEGLAYQRGTYYHRGLKMQFSDLLQMKGLSADLEERYLTVLRGKTTKDLCEACLQLIGSVDGHPFPPQPLCWQETVMEGQPLAELYQEIRSTFGKIERCTRKQNGVLAFLSAVCLQWELPWLDVLSAYDFTDLAPFAEQVQQAERLLRQRIVETGGSIQEYPDFEAFLKGQI